MIERYSRPEMKAVWSEDSKYASWAEVEQAQKIFPKFLNAV
jgi:adenylosuccinate lyase